MPIILTIEGDYRHDMQLVRATLESLVVERPAPTPEQPQGLCLDAGYDYDVGICHPAGVWLHRPCALARGRGQGAQAGSGL